MTTVHYIVHNYNVQCIILYQEHTSLYSLHSTCIVCVCVCVCVLQVRPSTSLGQLSQILEKDHFAIVMTESKKRDGM